MKKILKILFLMVFSVLMVLVTCGYLEYRQVLKQMPLEMKIAEIQKDEHYIEIEEISQYLKDATVSTEDKRFYEHDGIDPIAYGRILYVLVTSGQLSGGGSTITQQLAKNMYFTFQPSIIRKFAELFMTVRIESTIEKDEILELYLNIINYGDNNMGIYDASMNYFNKLPDELSFDEATLLAGIPQSPANYQLSNHEEEARIRQKAVINTLIENEYYEPAIMNQLLEEVEGY